MTPLLGFKNIAILAEDNPELAEIGREHDALIEEFNPLNEQIINDRVPAVPGKAEEKRFAEYARRVDDLQQRMLAWEMKAKSFIQKPSLTYASFDRRVDDAERRELQNQIVRTVSLIRSDMTHARTQLVGNHERLVAEARDKSNHDLATRSYKIGKWGLVFGLIGVALALVSIVISFLMAT